MAGLGAMNMSAFLPSLPHMTEYFSTRYDVMQLAVSLYLAVTAVMQVFIGPISDRYGRRRVVLGGQSIFVLATLGCIFAPTVEIFLFFRMMQGAVAVGLVLSRAIVRDMVPQNEAASMIGYVTMGMALVPMVAPMIGGALDEAFGWKAVFWMLAIVGTGVTVLCWADQGETSEGGGRSFAEQVKEYPELLTLPPILGLCFFRRFRQRGLLRLSGRRALCGVGRIQAVILLVRGLLWRACHRLCHWQLYFGALLGSVRYQCDDPDRRVDRRYGANHRDHPDCRWLWIGSVVLWVLYIRRPRQRTGDPECQRGHAVGPPASGRNGQSGLAARS